MPGGLSFLIGGEVFFSLFPHFPNIDIKTMNNCDLNLYFIYTFCSNTLQFLVLLPVLRHLDTKVAILLQIVMEPRPQATLLPATQLRLPATPLHHQATVLLLPPATVPLLPPTVLQVVVMELQVMTTRGVLHMQLWLRQITAVLQSVKNDLQKSEQLTILCSLTCKT